MKEIIWCVLNNRPPKLGCKLAHTDLHTDYSRLPSQGMMGEYFAYSIVTARQTESFIELFVYCSKCRRTPKIKRKATTKTVMTSKEGKIFKFKALGSRF